jgi:SAM-dependent methyltransferase
MMLLANCHREHRLHLLCDERRALRTNSPTASYIYRFRHVTETEHAMTASTPVALRERSYMMGNIVGIAAHHLNYRAFLHALAEHDYTITTTAHFVLCTKPQDSRKFVFHHFAPAELDMRIGHYCMQELQPLGILTTPEEFDNLLRAILFSVYPHDFQHALYLYSLNTYRTYHMSLASSTVHPALGTTMDMFARLYRRVLALAVGSSLLDAGCSLGMLALLAAGKRPGLTEVVGLDRNAQPFPVALAIAQAHGLHNVRFVEADLLNDCRSSTRRFDTVTLLHVLEHFSEEETPTVLAHLLAATTRRLIIAVPYEVGEPERVYDHKQLFSRAKLEHIGAQCLQQLGGGTLHYEDCEGGLLVIAR